MRRWVEDGSGRTVNDLYDLDDDRNKETNLDERHSDAENGNVQDAFEALRRTHDFSSARESTLRRLASAMRKRNFTAKELIFREGEDSDTAYVIEDGFVWLTVKRPDGNDHFIGESGRCDVFGQMTALSERPRIASARAASVVTAWEIPAEELRRSALEDPGLSYALMLNAIGLAFENDEEAAARSAQDTRQRTARTIADLHERGTDAEGTIAVTHAELAMMVGVARENVSRALASLRRRRIVETRRRGIVVLDEEALRRVAGLDQA